MSETFFIGDTHFGHRGILTYESEFRPFKDVDEMNNHLITEWNKVVSPKDIVWHLGDVAFGKRNIDLCGELNGTKYLVLGNHDTYGVDAYSPYFKRIVGSFQYDSCVLSHIPIHPQQLEHRFWANIHGHSHSRKFNTYGHRYVNVSCENLPNLAPIPYDEVINRATEAKTIKGENI